MAASRDSNKPSPVRAAGWVAMAFYTCKILYAVAVCTTLAGLDVFGTHYHRGGL